MGLSKLTKKQRERIHTFYMDVESLNQTVEHIRKKYRKVGGINRHQLSLYFKRHGLTVLPPNGRSVNDFRPINQYSSPESELASSILKSALDDIVKFQQGKGDKIDFLSACYFFTSELYRITLGLMNGSRFDVDENRLPEGLTEGVIRLGATLYRDQYSYWVCGV